MHELPLVPRLVIAGMLLIAAVVLTIVGENWRSRVFEKWGRERAARTKAERRRSRREERRLVREEQKRASEKNGQDDE
jgi:hypothetical protein